ncbi:MAG: D-alanine--D-alanine ligase, partial [Bacteroidota bacterium]
MDKGLQKELMNLYGFRLPEYIRIERNDWNTRDGGADEIHQQAISKLGGRFVVKAANQGSSIGVTVVAESTLTEFVKAVDKAFFIHRLDRKEWSEKSYPEKVEWVRQVSDLREGLGLPLRISGKLIYHPEELLSNLNQLFSEPMHEVVLEALDGEQTVLLEQFISGKEFSCIVIDGLDGKSIALPPTEIRKGGEVYDYRSKYLPGLSRKITPIDLSESDITSIRNECVRLYSSLGFGVYARIDGFFSDNGVIYLNDPNTTSGMLPSSFFFHQAAEIGLNPSQFITYIIHASLKRRITNSRETRKSPLLLTQLNQSIADAKRSLSSRTRIAVILGGYSSERHISVESGRNIFEKLSSSGKFVPVPVFLSGDSQSHKLTVIPVNILLKDNADDIREKIEHFKVHPVLRGIIDECNSITDTFANGASLQPPVEITYN